MKNLKESLLDDEDILMNNTIADPVVNKSDYIYYEQAWYNILKDMKDINENINLYIDLYLKWMPDLTISLELVDQDMLNAIIKYHDDKKNIIDFLEDHIHTRSAWNKKAINTLMFRNLKRIKNKEDIISYIFWPYDGLLLKIYKSKYFKNDKRTQDYYKYIKTALINKGMKFK